LFRWGPCAAVRRIFRRSVRRSSRSSPKAATLPRRRADRERVRRFVVSDDATRSSPSADRQVTVVIITRNRREELLRTLRDMTTLPEATPIIVVDNASSDGTSDAVATEFPDVEVLRLTENLGAQGRNLGVERV